MAKREVVRGNQTYWGSTVIPSRLVAAYRARVFNRVRLPVAAYALGCAALAVPTVAVIAQDAQQVRRFADVGMSPDGQHLAWIGPTRSGQSGGDGSVVLLDRGGTGASSTVALPAADSESASALAWSADSRQLAMLASTNGGSPALYVVPAAGGTARRVATVPGSVHELQFSPDGTRIAFLYSSPAEEANGPTAATPRDTGTIDSHIDRQHLALIDVASGTLRSISPADLYIYEFDWAPDSKKFVVSAAHGSGNNNWWVARLYGMDAQSGALHEIAKPATQIAEPRWSPDGTQIAYIGGLMSDQGQTGGDLYVIPSAGGEARDVTPGTTVSVASFSWRGENSLIVTSWAQGATQVATLDTRMGRLAPVWSADEYVTQGTGSSVPTVSATSDGSHIAVVRESLNSAPEVWAGPVGHLTQLTHVNDGVTAKAGKGVSVRWRSDAFNVQGFLIYPQTFDPQRKYPMVVYVHGGPSSATRPSYLAAPSEQAALSRAGYFVFMPNPRGSYGQGEAFTRANVKDFGHGDLRDIMAGVDTVIARFPVDGNRLGIKGWSYGGFMTMWAVTQTNRFRAAVAGAGLSNWLSYTGENGISEWMVPFFGATAYEDKAVYAKSSPINFIDRARTPTLVVVGERDAECPSPQSFEFWRGLQHAGVKTQLIVYPDEGHSFHIPEHRQDLLQRTVGWFDTYLK